MLKAAQVSVVVGVLLLICQIRLQVLASYRFERDYLQFWQLADKSSTLPAKQQYMAKFVSALESGYGKGEFAEYDAVFLKTPNNSFSANLAAVKTLAMRLSEIQEMNPTSFEYNTAIQQITAQEQGEARALIRIFSGCYELKSFMFVWNWVGCILLLTWMCLLVFSISVFMTEYA